MYKEEKALIDLLLEEKAIVDELNKKVLEKRLMYAKAESCDESSDEFEFTELAGRLACECGNLKDDLHEVRCEIGKTIAKYTYIK